MPFVSDDRNLRQVPSSLLTRAFVRYDPPTTIDSTVDPGSAGEDEGLDGVDQGGRLGWAGADLAEDLPVLQFGVGAFAGARSRAWAVLASFSLRDAGRRAASVRPRSAGRRDRR